MAIKLRRIKIILNLQKRSVGTGQQRDIVIYSAKLHNSFCLFIITTNMATNPPKPRTTGCIHRDSLHGKNITTEQEVGQGMLVVKLIIGICINYNMVPEFRSFRFFDYFRCPCTRNKVADRNSIVFPIQKNISNGLILLINMIFIIYLILIINITISFLLVNCHLRLWPNWLYTAF